MRLRLVVSILCVAFVPAASAAQQALPSIDQLMTPEEFRDAGLSKLTPEELRNLTHWIDKFGHMVQAVSERSARTGSPSDAENVTESRIDGEFNGWEGETIFKLQNGQIWQQSRYAYRYHYSYAPKVLIYKSSTGFMMRVDGVDEPIAVKRLK